MNDQQNLSTAGSVETFVELLIIATVVALITRNRRFRMPYTVALVIVGLAVGFSHTLRPIGLTTDVILLIFLPPLLFEGTISMDLEILREKWREVLLLALPVTLLSTIAVGAFAHLALGYTWAVSLLLGAILSPTDPISVLALFKELGVSKRLSIIVEGESCFNDGIGVVLYLILSRFVAGESISAGEVIWLFCAEVVGGLAIGVILGYAVYRILKHIDDYLIEVMISLVLAYGAYALADRLHVSGVMAVVAAGLIIGNYGRVFSMSPGTRIVLSSFWQVMAFIANSLLFLLMGIAAGRIQTGQFLWKVAALFIIITAVRMMLVYLSGGLLRLIRRPLPPGWQHIIGWSGLRGSIPVALVLGVVIPAGASGIPSREEFFALVIGVVTASLLIQGLSVKPLLTRLSLIQKDTGEAEFERLIGRKIALQAASTGLDEMNATGQLPHDLYERYRASLDEQSSALRETMAGYLSAHRDLAYSREDDLMRALALAERSSLEDACARGLISEEAFADLRKEVDSRIEGGNSRGND